MEDRSDEIRQHILRARQAGWAARAKYAEDLLEQADSNAVLARAVIGDLRFEMQR